MTTPNFGSILDREAPTEVEYPTPYPVGTYLFVVKGLPREDKSAKKATPFVEFILGFLQPGEDVDTEALAECLKGSSLNEKTMKLTFYLTENSYWRLDKFLIEDLGIEGGVSRRQMISATMNQQVLGHIKHRPSEDGMMMFAEIDSTAPVG